MWLEFQHKGPKVYSAGVLHFPGNIWDTLAVPKFTKAALSNFQNIMCCQELNIG